MNDRMTRAARWGIPAMLLAAGAAVGQQDTTKDQNKDMGATGAQPATTTDMTMQGDWKRADYIPSLAGIPLVIFQQTSDNAKPVTIAVDHGQVVALRIDNQDASLDRVQMKGNQLRVTDDSKAQSIAMVNVPTDVKSLAQGTSGYRNYGTTERYGNQQTWSSGQDQMSTANRNYPTFQQDRWSSTPSSTSPQVDRYTYSGNQWQYGQGAQANQPYYQSNQPYQPNYQSSYQQSTYQGGQWYGTNQPSSQSGTTYQSAQSGHPYTQDTSTTYLYQRQGGTMATPESAYGRPDQPTLGVMMSDASSDQVRQANTISRYTSGIMIDQVNPGSVAARSGLQQGDFIYSIDGQQPVTTETMRNTMLHKKSGDKLQLGVVRNGQDRNVTVDLGRMEGASMYYSPESGRLAGTPPSPAPAPAATTVYHTTTTTPTEMPANPPLIWYYNQDAFRPK
jgi:hypothetical protein